MVVTAKLVKQLREKTGAGIMDAKRALVANDGDIEAATDWLRTKGMSKAAKMATRSAEEGLVALSVVGGSGAIVEVNSETDFVAKNTEFRSLVSDIAQAAQRANSLEGLKDLDLNGKSVSLSIEERIATIRENLALKRMARLHGDSIASYVHKAVDTNVGRIGVLVAFRGNDEDGTGRKIAMHVAASRPIALSSDDMPADHLDRERQVLRQKALELGKPAAIVERIVAGGIKKFVSEHTLLEQNYVVNPDQSVGEAARSAGIEITGFVRFQVGEE